jgi:hypothetical protein
MKLEYSRQIFEKKAQTLNFTKIRPVAAELFHANGQTNVTKPIVNLRSFANLRRNSVGS